MSTTMPTNRCKKKVCFSEEKLFLVCEWESCTVSEVNMQIFLNHIVSKHLTSVVPGDLHCHWRDCEGFTDNLSELRRHILLHAFHTKIKCFGANLMARKNIPNCSAGLGSRNIVPELPDPLICWWENCSTLYECPEDFYRHVSAHADYDCKLSGKFICLWQDCNRTFGEVSKVKDHLRSHSQEKLVACPTCGAMFASRTKFFDHIQRQLEISVDGDDEVYICEYCPIQMSSERLLRDHMRHHVNHYKCPYCDMTCPTPSGIATHISYRHTEIKPHSCQYCDYKCKTESDLRKHLKSHSTVPTYTCTVENCSYATRSQACYRVHYRKEHEKKKPLTYSCHVCSKAFKRGNYLTKHLLKIHKFRWPSGHCRFRYCLDSDGLYRLQTVRYESLELTQEMMGEDTELVTEEGEIIDDPSTFMGDSLRSRSILVQPAADVVTVSQAASAVKLEEGSRSVKEDCSRSVKEDCSRSMKEEGLSVVCVPYYDQNGNRRGEEPVLIKIVDPNSPGNPFGDFNGNPSSTVQAITKDSSGVMIYETIEVVESVPDT